jgi:hypothetical protein
VKIHNEQDAIAAYLASRSDGIPEGYSVAARCVMDLSFVLEDGTCLWSVSQIPDDEVHMVFPGMRTIIGPEGKIWKYPANPNFFDDEIALRTLTHLYIEQVADLVDPDSWREQVELITTQRDRAIVAVCDAARRGDLRQAAKGH